MLNRTRNQKGFTLIELLIVVAIIGIIAAIAIPNLLNAIDRGKQKRTMADIRSVGTAVESYSIDNNNYPKASTTYTNLTAALEPLYIRKAPINDGWNNALQVGVDAGGTNYTLCSPAKNGGTTDCKTANGGAQTSFEDDITFSNGSFTQFPEGTQQ
ncbi:MAG: prepilin-type N-terminal cleavage/methylation domain-containing protein [bacterium]|nr:prepilin-type N-terminal cleavage/methylation domain-containing protein [bacterium]